MKSAAALLALIGFISVSQILGGAITDVAGKITIGGAVVITCKTDADVPTGGTLTITADRPIFAKNVGTLANKITTVSNPTKVGSHTAGTNAAGTVITLTATGAAFAQNAAAKVITFDTALLETAANGLQAGIVGITVSATGVGAPTTSGKVMAMIIGAAHTYAIGMPAMATSQFKGVAPGDYTFTFFPATTINSGSTLTISANQPIFTASASSATAPIKTFTQTATAAGGTANAITAGSTCVTDSAGKVLTITTAAALTADLLTTIVMQTVMANNPATASMVELTLDASHGSVTATSMKYPIFDKANEILFAGSDITSNKVIKAETATKIRMYITPQAAVAATKIITITASEAIWAAAASTTCALVSTGNTAVSAAVTCTASTTSVLKATIQTNYGLDADTMYTLEATSNIAANKASAAIVTFKIDADSADNVESATTYGYTVFNAATTAFFSSGVVTPLSATSTPTSLTVTFVPQTAAVGGTDKVTITASTAIFTASQTSGVTVACATNVLGYAKAVTCTAITDTTGKILTVTLSGSSGDNFLANAKSTVTLTNKLVANAASGTATTFAFETSTDTTGVTAQTGYTTTAAPAASATANSTANSTTAASGAAASTTYTLVQQKFDFPDLTAAAYTGNTKGNIECAYANTVELGAATTTPTWCTVTTTSPFRTYKTGISITSSAARRAASVTFKLKVDTSIKTLDQVKNAIVKQTSIADNFNAKLTAVNTGTGLNITSPGTPKVHAASYTPVGSGASNLLPSMLGLVSALFIAFKHM